jgi:hypothetical protein
MKRSPAFLALAAAALPLLVSLAPHALAASHGPCAPTGLLGLGVVSLGVAYVDDRGLSAGTGTWVYLESNGIAGLQRGSSSLVVPGDQDPCWDDSANGPDQLVI